MRHIHFSVAQLLKNDKSNTGTVSFAGLTNAATNGSASYDAAKQTITFIPTANFNGVASFGLRRCLRLPRINDRDARRFEGGRVA